MPVYSGILFALVLALSGCASLSSPPVDSAAGSASGIRGDELPLDPAIVHGRLDNGLTYYIKRNVRPENRVELRLGVNAGSILEEDDQQGLAHFLEHMAFNGTEHFAANELVDYLESIGTRFGPDLNAYTSFDETVYMLQVPTDVDGLLEQGVLVLRDWAGGMTLDPEEVEKERGVVLEEWRLGQGAQQRLRRRHWPVLLQGSRYADRLPIGDPAVIENAPRQRLLDFYQRWYRPDLMTVVAVGDVDPAAMESLIRERFSDLPRPAGPADRPVYGVPGHPQPLASIASDPELPVTQIVVAYKSPARESNSVDAYRRSLVTGLVTDMLNARISEIREKPDAPFVVAGLGAGSPFRSVELFQGFAIAPEGGLEGALTALLTELERVRAHGFGAGELARAKARFLANMEKAYNERDKTESATLAAEYLRHFLEGEPVPGIEAEFALSRELIAGITLDDVQQRIPELVHAENQVILVSEPERPEGPAQSADDLLALAEAASAATPEPYEDLTSSADLVANPPIPGTVVERRENASLGTVHLRLNNGVKVVYKTTDFKNDEVLLGAQTQGGRSLAPRDEFLSSGIAVPLVEEGGLGSFTPTELQKLMAGKLASAAPSVGLFTHGIRGAGTPQDLETVLQLVYLYFTAPHRRAEAFDVMMEQYREFVKNRERVPSTRFGDRVNELNTGGHYMFEPLTLDALDRMDPQAAWAFYDARFNDASDMTFYVVGALSPDRDEALLARWLGALPSRPGTPVTLRDPGLSFPAGVHRERVYAGTEPKSQTQVTWPALTGLDELEMFYLRKAGDILEIRLRELLREELGGTYSVRVGYQPMYPYAPYATTQIAFGSSPENADGLLREVLDTVRRFQEEGPTQEEVDTARELELRGLEEGSRTNGYWLGSFMTLDLLGWDLNRVLARKERAQSLSPQVLHRVIARHFPADNYTAVTLLPESERPAAGD